MPSKPFTAKSISFKELGPPRYEQLAQSIEAAIRHGQLAPGDRLPPVRELAEELGISVTTVTAAFELLSAGKLIRAEVGRGTFVSEPPVVRPARAVAEPVARTLPQPRRSPWRRRSLMSSGVRLRTLYPNALDCSTGRPDVSLLPVSVLRRAGKAVLQAVASQDLQYAGPEPVKQLCGPLVRLLARDGIEAAPEHLLMGSSAQQLMVLSLELAFMTGRGGNVTVAVEEPGYPTIMDAFERAGARLIPVAMDENGAVPESLDVALRSGAVMVLLTPAAQNPTGSSWSAERRAALAAVLAEHPNTLVVEDDQFADVAATRPGSLLSHDGVGDRVIHIRSFSKAIGPDLRVAAVAARPRLRALLAEAKSFADGWTSHLLQRTLARVLEDDELNPLLARAREAYRLRRTQAAEALNSALNGDGGWTWCGPDGLNLWVHLPGGLDAAEVADRAAAAGVRIAPGEPFFVRPGHSDVLRLNAGSVPTEKAAAAGRITAESALASGTERHSLIHV